MHAGTIADYTIVQNNNYHISAFYVIVYSVTVIFTVATVSVTGNIAKIC